MIQFHNGHKYDYGVASGALSFDGDGWWFEQPWRWMGILRPEEFTIITKTLTYEPRKGNYRWYAPWRCVRLLENRSVVNAVALSNPGYIWWLAHCRRKIAKRGYKVIVSIAPTTASEAVTMVHLLSGTECIVGIQLNLSCPNVNKLDNLDYVCTMTRLVRKHCDLPLILKLGYADGPTTICKELDGIVDAFELINAVPYSIIHPHGTSPLLKYGYTGSVSGADITVHARTALIDAKKMKIKTPIISGGGVDSLHEARLRETLGADAVNFGSVFIRKPWLPNRIVKELRKGKTPLVSDGSYANIAYDRSE